MTDEQHELVEATRLMRRDAQRILWAHAVDHCQQVRAEQVDAIANALGDISLGEAIGVVERLQREALDRLQREAVAGSWR